MVPPYVPAYGKPKTGKYYRWFPKIFLYAVILGCSYVAILLSVSSLFPLDVAASLFACNRRALRCSARLVSPVCVSNPKNSGF